MIPVSHYGWFPTTIEHDPARPWRRRTRLAARFWTVVRHFLALTTRINPNTLSAALADESSRPHRSPCQDQAGLTTQPNAASARAMLAGKASACIARRRVPAPSAPLSARDLARRLATLLRQLIDLAADAAAPLPRAIHSHAARIRQIIVRHVAPQTWERAG